MLILKQEDNPKKKVKISSLNTLPSLREIIINSFSLILWKMLNDRNRTSYETEGYFMEYKNNNALLLLMATINSLRCVRYGPFVVLDTGIFLIIL